MIKLEFEKLESNNLGEFYRARVYDGWIIVGFLGSKVGMAFVPDNFAKWDTDKESLVPVLSNDIQSIEIKRPANISEARQLYRKKDDLNKYHTKIAELELRIARLENALAGPPHEDEEVQDDFPHARQGGVS